jgi:hypothetical protein
MIAIPVISSLLVVILISVLLAVKLFSHHLIVILTCLLMIMAMIRVRKFLISYPVKYHRVYKLLLFNFLLMLPFFVKLGTHSFDQGDEIYSWNYWAIQHYLSLPADFTHTAAPYPQFLPKLLAYQYQLLGNIDYQLPIKCLLGLFPLTLLNTLAIAYSHRSVSTKFKYGLLIIWIVFGIGLQHFFNDGYADPIMSASLVLSVYYAWIAYHHKNKQNTYWSLSLGAALVAAYAKQPGLLWLGFILPLGYILSHYSDCLKHKLKSGLFVLFSSGMALLWVSTEGKQFQDNGGVIAASLKNRDIWGHLAYLAEFYFLQQPLLGLFLVLSIIGLIRYICITKKVKNKRFIIFVFSLLILPYLILWFTFGAYQLRLGQHVVALLSLMVILSGYKGFTLFSSRDGLLRFARNDKKENRDDKNVTRNFVIPNAVRDLSFKKPFKFSFIAFTFLSVLASIMIGYKQEYKIMKGIPWEASGQRSLQVYFPDAREIIATHLYKKPDIKLWVPTRYLYGLFYGHTPISMPDQNWTVQDLMQANPDYVITASKEITAAAWVDQLADMIHACPAGFTPLNSGDNRFNYIAYRVDRQGLNHCYG